VIGFEELLKEILTSTGLGNIDVRFGNWLQCLFIP